LVGDFEEDVKVFCKSFPCPHQILKEWAGGGGATPSRPFLKNLVGTRKGFAENLDIHLKIPYQPTES
jgi:hypothetical protein